MESSPETGGQASTAEQVESETCERLWSKKGSPKGHQSDQGARRSNGNWDMEPGI